MRARLGVGIAVGTLLLAVIALALAARSGVPPLVLALSPDVVLALVAPPTAALILHRHPRHRIGWILLVVGACSALYGFGAAGSATLAETGGPAEVVRWLAWLSSWVWYPSFALMFSFALLLFPDGRLPHRVFVPVAWAAGAVLFVRTLLTMTEPDEGWAESGMQNPTGVDISATIDRLLEPGFDLLWPLIVVSSVAALIVRWWQGDAVVRVQIGWVAAAAAIGATVYLVTANGTALAIAVPAAYLVAILRYRLFMIERVLINAIVYGTLTLLVAMVHVAVAFAVGSIGSLPEQTVGAGVAITLLAVLLFQPVHRWLDRAARRMVYGPLAIPHEVVTDLARRLAASLDPKDLHGEVESTLENALHRSVSIVDRPPDDGSSVELIPVEHLGSPVAYLAVEVGDGQALGERERRVIADLAAQSGPALHNLRLLRQLERQLQDLQEKSRQLQRSRARLVAAQDDERRRLERDLHDGVQQRLLALSIQLGQLAAKAPSGESAALSALQAQAETITHELRSLTRGMYPPVLTDLGLEAALTSHVLDTAAPVRLHVDLPDRYPAAIETAVYFMCLEAMTNAIRHSDARLIDITMKEQDNQVVLQVRDDGRGFDLDAAYAARGRGLDNLGDRSEAVGGSLDIQTGPGRGTVITARVPLTLQDGLHVDEDGPPDQAPSFAVADR